MTSTTFEMARSSQLSPEIAAFLQVNRTDINFASRSPDLVDIRVLVTNAGAEYSQPTNAVLSAAPLGAFVPWQPLTTVPVPGLAPGESFVVRGQARPRRCRPLGTPDRVPPRQLLVALGADDGDHPPRRELPSDPLNLLMRGDVHWAGNLNIFIGGRAVERHLAQSLRVYPGRPNMAIFIVGAGRDAYAFRLEGAADQWNAAIFDLTRAPSLLPAGGGSNLPLDRWVELNGHAMMILALHPPMNCSRETVEVRVTQRSTAETAIVEFSLDPSAAGPGCYVA